MSRHCYCVEQYGFTTDYGDYNGDVEYISKNTTYMKALKIYEKCIDQIYADDPDDPEFHGSIYLVKNNTKYPKIIKTEYFY